MFFNETRHVKTSRLPQVGHHLGLRFWFHFFHFLFIFFILLIYAGIIQYLLLMFSPAEEDTFSYSKSIFQMPTSLAIFTYSFHFIIRIVSLFPMDKQKQPPRGVFKKRCSENMQQIYRRTPMRKRDFNKAALKLY